MTKVTFILASGSFILLPCISHKIEYIVYCIDNFGFTTSTTSNLRLRAVRCEKTSLVPSLSSQEEIE